MKSIRRYLKRRIFFGVIPILGVCNFLLALIMRDLDIQEFNETLETKAQTLATLIFRDETGAHMDIVEEYIPEFSRPEDGEFFQLSRLDGTRLERSKSLGANDLPVFPDALEENVFMNLRLMDGTPIRMVQMVFPLTPSGEDAQDAQVILAVAHSSKALNKLLFSIYAILLVMNLLLLTLVYFWVGRTLQRGIEPLAELNRQLENIHPASLDKRVVLSRVPEELELVTQSLNTLLEDLQSAFRREQRFSGDVAHELRTPVAEMRLASEIGAKWGDDPAIALDRFRDIQESARQMEAKVNALLALSRLNQEHAEAAPLENVPMAEVVQQVWRKLVHAGNPLELRHACEVPPELAVRTNGTKLEMILVNLFENALAYSRAKSTVTTRGGRDAEGHAWLAICNPVEDLDEADVQHLFERFWRKDTARSDGRHAGLGLSIVKALAGLLHIRLQARMEENAQLCIHLHFPRE